MKHTDKEFEAELERLRSMILEMAGRVEELIAQALTSFLALDADLAKQTILLDRHVNQAELDIDDHCLVILAKRQPMGPDLRFITIALKMVTDLERIGDLAVNVCERTLRIDGLPIQSERIKSDLPHMAGLAQKMVRASIDAFSTSDEDAARQVIVSDDLVDETYHSVFRYVLDLMIEKPALIERGLHVQAVAKFLERMGDHATNLAEQVVYMSVGSDIRHPGKLPVDR